MKKKSWEHRPWVIRKCLRGCIWGNVSTRAATGYCWFEQRVNWLLGDAYTLGATGLRPSHSSNNTLSTHTHTHTLGCSICDSRGSCSLLHRPCCNFHTVAKNMKSEEQFNWLNTLPTTVMDITNQKIDKFWVESPSQCPSYERLVCYLLICLFCVLIHTHGSGCFL